MGNKKSKEQIAGEIYWIFRDMIHNGHTEIRVENGQITSFKPLEDTSCYVCDILSKLEDRISKALGMGDEYFNPNSHKN
jgi:hypothetical protein